MGIFSFFRKGKKKDSFNDAIKSQLLPEDQQNIEQLVQKEVVIEKTLEEQKAEIERRIMAIQRSTRVSIHAFERWHNELRSKYKWYYKWHVNPLSSFVHWVTLSGYTASMAAFVLSYLFTTAVVQIYAASAQTWGSQSGWSEWQLSDTSLDNNVLKLSPSEGGDYVASGSATLAFSAPDSEVVDWLSTDSDELLSGATITEEFSTDNVLFTDKIENLADSSNLYIKVGLSTQDASVTPILNSLSVHYSRLPYSPDSPAFKIDKTVLGAKQILKGGVFADPDGDQHKASQWQVAKSSGDYANAFLDTGSIESRDPADLTSFVLPHALDQGTYYFRVRYQDTTGAWGLWSKECAFEVEDNNVALNIGTDVSSATTNENEIIASRTETTKTIDNKDGTKTLESYSGLIHYKDSYQDPNAQWKDINPNHSIDTPEYVLFDQMPSTVKVFKDKIGYEIESRKTGDKYTVELESLDGAPKLSTNSAISNKQLAISNDSNRLVSWADINTKDSQPSTVNRQPLAQWLMPHALADEPQVTTDDGNLKFEFDISEYGVRLWKTITGPDAPKNFTWNITKTDGVKDTTTDDLKFRENPEAFEINSSTPTSPNTPTPVTIETKKSDSVILTPSEAEGEGSQSSIAKNSGDSSAESTLSQPNVPQNDIAGKSSSFTWSETAPKTDLKIDTDVTYYSGAGDGMVEAVVLGSDTFPACFDIPHGASSGTADYTSTTATVSSQKIDNGDGTCNGIIDRSFLPFDTSALPDTATISATTLSVYPTSVTDGLPADANSVIGVVQTTSASTSTLTGTDYVQIGTTLGATALDTSSVTASAYNNIALNSTGIGWISLTAFTKLGLREGHDYTNNNFIPVINQVTFSTSEQTGTDHDPKLAITYTVASPPTAPSGVSIDTAATDGFTAHWTDNSSDETGFKVYVSTTPTSGNPTPCDATATYALYTTTAAAATSQAVTGQALNSQYCVKVLATNGSGDSSAAYAAAPLYTLANVPSAPTVNPASSTSLTIIINENSNPATTTYAIKAVYGATTKYVTTAGALQDAAAWDTYANFGGASGVANTSLTQGTTYTYSVEARNGDLTATALSSGTSKYTLANTPALTSVAGDYDTSDLYHLDVTINANGNPAGTNYYLQYSTNDSDYLDPNAMDWQTATTYIFKKTSVNADLTGNTQYWIKVQAKNGDGTATGYSGSSPDVTPPAAPGSLNSSNLCRTTASTSWGAATGADTYTFSYGTDELATNLGTTADIAVTNKDLTGLTNSTTYYFKVSPTSTANGTGAYSSIASFATTSCTAPTAPSDFAGSAASTTQINWTWSDSADDETAWAVHDSSHSSVSGALAAGTTSYNETPLSVNTAYTRHANVSNGNGNNDSNQVTVYTLANAPSAPTVTAASSSSITVTVNKNSNPEATTRYAIAVSSDGGATWAYVKNSDGTTQVSEDWQLYADWGGAFGFANTGLTAAKEYTYKVKARNGDSVGTAFSATATATSSNPTIQFTSATASGAESTTSVNIAISIGNASALDSSVDYAVSGGTATGSGTDYTLASGTATITAGNTTTNIAVTVVNDTLDENDETVIVAISSPTNATLGSNITHTYTITDNDDAPTVAFTSATGSGAESVTPVNLEVSLSAASGKTVTVDYAVTGGTATGSGTDYTLASGTATITAGSTTANIALTVVNDILDENDETVVVTLSNPSNSSIGSNTTDIYTITDDDASPTVAFTTASSFGSEATTPVNLELTLSTVSGRNVAVDYAVSGGTATGGGVDYTLASGTATITAGSTTTNVALTVANDILDEDDETVIVTLSSPSNATLGVNSSYTYTITDNDDAPTVAFTSATGSGAESTAAVNLEVSLSAASSKTITVDYTVSGTATGSGTDYTLASGTATIAAGSTTTNVALTIVNDLLVEIDETVIVTLSNPANATLGVNTTNTYTIVSEDVPPTGTISINAGAARSNSTTVALTLSSSTASEMKISGTADLSGASYEAYSTSKSFTLSAGDGERTVYAKFKDAGTNESEIYSDSIILDTTGPSAPTNLTAISGSASISLSWTNPSASDFAKVAIFRSTTASFTANILTNKIANTENSTTATYTDSSVTNGVAYYYQIKALDNDDNYSVASAEVSGKPDADNPTTPGAPTINGGVTNPDGKTIINSKDATLAWTAASDPNSGIKGYYVSIGTTSGGSEIVANKEILISSLTDPTLPSTLYSLLSDGTYYVRIQAKDNLGNISAYSGEFVFIVDTTAPSAPAEAYMYDVSNRAEGFYVVALTFKSSSDDGSGLKGYIISKNGSPILDNTEKSLTDKIASDSVSGYSSYIDLSSADAVSSYSIKAVDFAGNITENIAAQLADTEIVRSTKQTAGSSQIKLASSIIGEGQLEISDIISSPSSLVGKKTQAKITWKTTVPSSTQVEYGQSSEYASKTELDTGLNSTHTAILSELLPATTYHYRVISKDKYGNEVASPDQTFITNQPVQDESVLELIIDNLSQALSGLWSGIKGIFSLNPDYSLAADSKAISKLSVANISTEQRPAYIAYWPLGKGNVKVERSENGTSFVTLANTDQNFYVDFSAKAKVDYTYRVYGESAVISEESGGKAVISDIKTEAGLTSADEASVIITFQTDALAKSQISYGESAGYGADTELDNALNQSHTMLIEKLKPKTLYHFKVRTTDKSDGNISESEDNTFVTADAPVDLSLLQLIIKSLSDAFAGFGNWMGS